MPWCLPSLGSRIRSFLRDCDALQSLALTLIYFQIGCALIGSLGALFNGVLVINLVIGLFAVVAIESSSQRLGRTYAVLLFFAIVLDVAWFILFSHAIWNITPDEKYGPLLVFSLRLALWMQIIGFSMRFSSSFIWIQMYRLGISSNNPAYYEANYDARNSFLSPTANVVRQSSIADDILGGSIYDPSYYSSLFEDVRDNGCTHQGEKQIGNVDSGSTSAGQSPRLKSFASRSFQANDDALNIVPRMSASHSRYCPLASTAVGWCPLAHGPVRRMRMTMYLFCPGNASGNILALIPSGWYIRMHLNIGILD